MELEVSPTNLFEQILGSGASSRGLSVIQDINDLLIADGGYLSLPSQSVWPVIGKGAHELRADYYNIMYERSLTESLDDLKDEVLKYGGWGLHARVTMEKHQTVEHNSTLENLRRAQDIAQAMADNTLQIRLQGAKDSAQIRIDAELANARLFDGLSKKRAPSPLLAKKIKQGLKASRRMNAELWAENNPKEYNESLRFAAGVIAKSRREDKVTADIRAEAKRFVDIQIKEGVYANKMTAVILAQRTGWAKKANLPKPTLEQVLPIKLKREVAKIRAKERIAAEDKTHVTPKSLADNLARVIVAHMALKNGIRNVSLRSDIDVKDGMVVERAGNFMVLHDNVTGENVVKMTTSKGKALNVQKGDEIRSGQIFRNNELVDQNAKPTKKSKSKDDGLTR